MSVKEDEIEPQELAEMIKKINENTKYKIVSADDYQFIEQRRRSRLGFGSPGDRKGVGLHVLGERGFSSDRSVISHYRHASVPTQLVKITFREFLNDILNTNSMHTYC